MSSAITILAALFLVCGVPILHAQTDTVPTRPVPGTHNCDHYYPEAARRRGESGNVLIHYDVQIDGRITNVFVLRGSGSEILDVAAIACVYERWRNIPAVRNGYKVASRDHKASIHFRLMNDDLSEHAKAESPSAFFMLVALLAMAAATLVLFIDRRRPQTQFRRKNQN